MSSESKPSAETELYERFWGMRQTLWENGAQIHRESWQSVTESIYLDQ